VAQARFANYQSSERREFSALFSVALDRRVSATSFDGSDTSLITHRPSISWLTRYGYIGRKNFTVSHAGQDVVHARSAALVDFNDGAL
jgi:hypothetical protein